MSFPAERRYRLVRRGEVGLVCDEKGVALGGMPLVDVRRNAGGAAACAVRSLREIDRVLTLAFGAASDAAMTRLHRGLCKVARWIEAGDLCLASIETVMLGIPDLTVDGVAKLTAVARFEKFGTGWENQPRVPAGQADGGRWTADGTGGSLVDGIYRPAYDKPRLIPVGGAEEDEPSRRSNGPPPDEVTSLLQVFPGLENAPALGIPLAPIDGFLGITASADEANLEATTGLYRHLTAEIRAIDPTFVDETLLPEGGIAGLSWQGRNNLIDDLRMTWAATLYRMRGDIGPLQVETLRFLQKAVDEAYAEGVKKYDEGRLKMNLSRGEAIGNYVDRWVRGKLQSIYDDHRISYGIGKDITINNRDYDTSLSSNTYTIPDARLGDISFDWTLTAKSISNQQIRGFFAADSKPQGVVIVRPNKIGSDNTYLIPRPADLKPKR